MNLKNTMFILIIIVFLLQMVVLKQDAQIASSEKNTVKPTIALSTFPLYDIAKNLAQNKMKTYMILPVGVDAHSYEPNPKEIVKLHKSALVVYSGADLEPWIAHLNFTNKTIDMSKHVSLIKLDATSHTEHTHHDHDDSCTHGSVDPHYWLSIDNMIKATKQIAGAMIELDVKNKNFYLENQKKYIKMLHELDAVYKSTLSHCKIKEILTNHNAFSYLAQSYDFEILSLSGLSPDAEVSAKNMISLIEHIKEHNISTIFYENFASSKAIESVAKESNIDIEVLQPLANITAAEEKQDLSYEDIMKINLSKLKKAMNCR